MWSRVRREYAYAPATVAGIVAVVALLATTGCGGGSDEAQSSPNTGPVQTATAGPAQEPAGEGPQIWLTLTGGYTYDGPATGYFVCYHDDAAGYFQLEAQEPYYLAIIASEDLRSGTFTLSEQDPDTGFLEVTPGEPRLDVRGLSAVDANDQLALRHAGGTITFVDNGASGSLSSDWIDDFNGATVHSEVTWEGCGSA